jgi:xanthine/CO dehydrogenase XdhC/CoxF family maturation factor
MAMFQQKIKRITYDTREDDPFQLGIGLGCQGLIEIMIDPIRENIQQVYKVIKSQIFSGKGQFARSEWSTDKFSMSLINQANLGWEETSQVFTEYLPPRIRIWIVGNQFDACSLIDLCLNLAWEVHWVGNTAKMRKSIREKVQAIYDWDSVTGMMSSDCLVIMTHDFERDVQFINQYIGGTAFNYLGILGPSKRFERLEKQLNVKLVSDVSTPIGLDLGAEGPDEIAVAIVAEILALQNKRTGQRLKYRESTIH